MLSLYISGASLDLVLPSLVRLRICIGYRIYTHTYVGMELDVWKGQEIWQKRKEWDHNTEKLVKMYSIKHQATQCYDYSIMTTTPLVPCHAVKVTGPEPEG